jgi:nucleotide-binding universal stress UspA family protein
VPAIGGRPAPRLRKARAEPAGGTSAAPIDAILSGVNLRGGNLRQNTPVHSTSEDLMTYRSIFVHADDSEPCARRFAVAARLARKYPAELLGGYLVPSTWVTPYASTVMGPENVKEWIRHAANLRTKAEATFRAAAAAAGLTEVAWEIPQGDMVEAAVVYSRYADLAVIGQPSRDEPTYDFANEIANAIVMSSGRPVLFVPSAGEYETVGERVLIAWKDSRESARAVADALPLLKDAKEVTAVAIAPARDESARSKFTDDQVESFLARHNVTAKVQRVVAPDIDAGELLLSYAADFGADLIVMGAYSRPRVTEMVWGGVTRVMLTSMSAPVLMSH